MTPALLIFLFTLVVFICALAIARRPRQQERTDDLYLDAPVWQGARAETKAVAADAHADETTRDSQETSRAHLVAAAAKIEPPKGARLRNTGAESTRVADAAEQQTRLFDEIVSGLQRIPPLPHVLFQIMRELDHAGSTARSLGTIVAGEPVLTATLLRVANSASTGLRRKIISVDEAVTYLGYSAVRSLVMRMKLAELMPQRSLRGYDSEQLWMHSIVVAQIAAQLMKRAKPQATRAPVTLTTAAAPDQRSAPHVAPADVVAAPSLANDADGSLVTTIALLHDIGKLAINSQFPELVHRLWQRPAPADGVPADESFLARERRLFGADHAFLGAFLAAQWKLPSELVEAIRLHHLPAPDCVAALPPEVARAVRIVHVANQLAKYSHVYCADMEIDIVPESLLAELGLPTAMEDLLDDEVHRAIARASTLMGSSGSDGLDGPIAGGRAA